MTAQQYQQLYRRGDTAQRRQNALNREQGQEFERMIGLSCDYYNATGAAEIEKTPEPMVPTKSLGQGKFMAHYEKKAQPDYGGTLAGGRAVHFEAKSTRTDRLYRNKVNEEQTRKLNSHTKLGAVTFVIVAFDLQYFYRVPWAVWRDMKQHFGRQYVKPEDLDAYRLHITPDGMLMFLEGLEDVA